MIQPPSLRSASIATLMFLLVASAWCGAADGPRFVHTVKPGDTLWKLSRQHAVSIEAIRQANGLTGSLIRVGQRLTIPTKVAKSPTPESIDPWARAKVSGTEQVDDWKIEYLQHPDSEEAQAVRARVWRRGTLVWTTDAALDVEVAVYPGRDRLKPGSASEYAGDLTGEGKPLLFVRSTDDLKRFMFDTVIVDPGPPAKVIGQLAYVPSEGPRFRDLDNDGVAEAIVGDTAFGGYLGRPVDDHHPEVILRRGKAGFEPVADMMRKPPLSSADFTDLVKQLQTEVAGEAPEWTRALLRPLTDLAYGGNLEQAKLLFDRVAPWAGRARDEQWAHFCRSLAGSDYWPKLTEAWERSKR